MGGRQEETNRTRLFDHVSTVPNDAFRSQAKGARFSNARACSVSLHAVSFRNPRKRDARRLWRGVLSNLDVIGAASISWQSGLDWRDTKHCPRGDWSVGFTKQSRRSWGRYRSGTGWTGWDCARWRIFGSLQMNGSMFGPSKCRGVQGGCEVEEKVQVVQVMYAGSLGIDFCLALLENEMWWKPQWQGPGRAPVSLDEKRKGRNSPPEETSS